MKEKVHSGVHLISYVLVAVILIMSHAYNIYNYHMEEDKAINAFHSTIAQSIDKQQDVLDSGMETMFRNVLLQASWMEKQLEDSSTKEISTELTWVYDEDLNISSLSEKHRNLSGNIVVNGPIDSACSTSTREINALTKSMEMMHFIVENDIFQSWTAYYSKCGIIGLMPFENASDIIEDNSIFEHVRLSIETMESESTLDQLKKGWESDVFYDRTYSILMFSKNIPVFIGDKSVGIMTSNFSIDAIPQLITQPKNVTGIYVLDSSGNIVSKDHTEIHNIERFNLIDLNSEDVNILPSTHIQLKETEQMYYYWTTLDNADWTLVYEVNKASLPPYADRLKTLTMVNAIVLLVLGSLMLYFIRVVEKLNKKRNRKLIYEAKFDTMTGALKKKPMWDLLNEYIQKKVPFSVLMMDLDNFKNINDTYGHLLGDEILRAIALDIKSHIRPEDSFARYGGEEFVVILKSANPKTAKEISERIRKSVESKRFTHRALSMTLSIGVAHQTENITAEELIELADQKMYKAKANGKNQIVS